MRDLQADIITTLGVTPSIDPAVEVQRRVDVLVDYAAKADAKGFVLGISGGVDSTVGGRICQLAAEAGRAAGHDLQFHAVMIPHKIQSDAADAHAAMDLIAPDHRHTFNIGSTTDAFAAEFATAFAEPSTDYNLGNVKARLRMVVQFALAGQLGLLVVGTDQAAEAVTGFYTKFGDGAADIMPLAGLNKRQIRALADHLGASVALRDKAPTADLLTEKPGQLDEVELGVSYDAIDDYLEGKTVSDADAEQIEKLYLRSQHKRHLPVTPADKWWL
ncbi:ammonia-dependent NAD(+) synthetase [Micrococcoides hystricis]|uniref:NH(3)-dependent NAD(+) synthetase n=1 Tax=Micrococcoides hystricis TaxID=1572761 RepID=A0ABV6PCP5_9MICC